MLTVYGLLTHILCISNILVSLKACSFTNGTKTFNTNSCNDAYACRLVKGVASFGSSACNAPHACELLSGNTVIQDGSCSGSGSCARFSNNMTIMVRNVAVRIVIVELVYSLSRAFDLMVAFDNSGQRRSF